MNKAIIALFIAIDSGILVLLWLVLQEIRKIADEIRRISNFEPAERPKRLIKRRARRMTDTAKDWLEARGSGK